MLGEWGGWPTTTVRVVDSPLRFGRGDRRATRVERAASTDLDRAVS